MGSPGIDELRWLSPVRPGDTLHTVVDVKEVIPSKSKSDRGIVRLCYAAINQHDKEALSFVLNHFLRRRPA